MSDTKMSGERAREILLGLVPHGPMPVQPIWKGEENEAILLGAAAIEEREELVAFLECMVNLESTPRICEPNEPQATSELLALLVKHGRVVRDGETYEWSDRR